MGRYLLRRLLQLIPVFIGTTLIIYLLVWAIPGDPFAGKCGDRGCPPEYIAEMHAKYNLDDPLIIQYFKYLGKLFTGDFGETYAGIQVSQLIENAYPVTIKLALVALIIEAVIGLLAGIVTGLRGRSFLDNLVLVSTLFLISLPVFVTGFVIQISLGTELGIIRPTVSSDPSIGELIAPGFVLGSLSMAYVARLTRTSLMENRRADYVRTAVAKGLEPKRVVGVHLLRNSVIPVITFLGTDLGALMGGAIVTEGVFNIRGIGGLIFRSILTKEGTTVTGIVTLLVIVYLLMNLIVDLLYAALDPRIRYD
ncbi:oligopeptide transport system permease protein [Saccharopolyspora erythraea NRRL 2338]|uniref:Peptide ABC transporter, permease component n=2 Tax=Saccharopolyspora erythraea TaxID=1836 RepID=A4F811_SACEN|nr:ABC transporter permease [Saccharopolyspora erythraea]EQD85788.1 ABC transporter permease [Saccharopolyspora erythraea D]PFG93982.1 oligopeptide transport system permease protein [Saccharopolyspora erythraea NRRL 2338]QRK90792.1 ABC transporter permease [Saccharopolyspora erythraea]CAM00185.1 putative peptide ABC transporter, permease component [Saccharopolyspora erythraea NRRL 2338]